MNEHIEQIASDFRLKNHILDFPLDFKKICTLIREEGYEIISYDEIRSLSNPNVFDFPQYCQNQAYTFCQDGNKVVCFDNRLPYDERNFALAHEWGHIRLDHVNHRILAKSGDIDTINRQESEADDMAIHLLAPPCLLAFVTPDDTLSEKKIQKLTALPEEYARRICPVVNAFKKAGRSELIPVEEKLINVYCAEYGIQPYHETQKAPALPDPLDKEDLPTFWEKHWYILTGIGLILIGSSIMIGIWYYFFQ